MPLTIPTVSERIGDFAKDLIDQCHTSLENRRMRGAAYRNLYLTGSEEGTPQTYKKTYAYIQTLAALLYSPVNLRFAVAPYGPAGPRDRAMGRSAATVLLEYFRGGSVDTTIEDAVEWGLVKGKTFIQLDWSRGGLSAHMVQPETMGVLRDDINRLDKQDAFVHSTWLTEARFRDHIAAHPKRAELLSKIKTLTTSGEDRPDTADNSRQVMIGGQLYPFKAQGSPGAGKGRGLVNWLSAPMPELDTKIVEKLIRLDELWVWDGDRGDWTTFQVVGNVVIEPTKQHRNIFADGYERAKATGRRVGRGEPANSDNPLTGHHPFIEICPNPLPDYMWGWSEVQNVGMLQIAINNRVDGINRLLRRQERPSWLISGASSTASKLKSVLNRPDGWHVEQGGANLKVEKMAPDLPVGLWESLHELVAFFDDVGGMTAVMSGQGEAGVRAQGHAETLVRMSSPRFKDRALGIERQVEEVGGLALDMLKGHVADEQVLWVKEADAGPFKDKLLDPTLYEPPAPGLVAIGYQMTHVGDRFRVSIDSHSASPIFSHEARELAMLLAQRGALSPEDLIRMLHPPDEEALVAAVETREANKAAMIQSLPPEQRIQAITGHAPRRGHQTR